MPREPKVREQKSKIAARVSGTPARTAARRTLRKATGRSVLPRRASTLQSVRAHALDTFGSEKKAQHWMNRPNPLLQGKTPGQVVQSDPSLVEAALVRIDYGVYV